MDDIEALLVGIGIQLLYPQSSVTLKDIGMTLWSCATLEFVNDNLYHQLASHLNAAEAYTYKAQELSNALWAFATRSEFKGCQCL